MKKLISCGILILILIWSGGAALGETLVQTETFYSVQKVSVSVAEYNETRTVTFPEKPLQFASTVEWGITFDKKWTIATNQKASVKIDFIDTGGKERKVELFNPRENKSGSLDLQPGQRCRITLFAGKYSNLFKRYGANIKATCKYQNVKVQVKAEETRDIGRFKLNVESIPAARWIWTLPDGRQVAGNTNEITFPAGPIVIKLSSFSFPDSFQFNLAVAEPLEAKPGVDPPEGYEDLTVRCFTNLINHYQSTSNCSWDFGDGSPVQTGETTTHIYREPGVYLTRLKIINSLGTVIKKDWEITVRPFSVKNTATISPVRGAVPLAVSFRAEPFIFGTEPASFEYLWYFGDGSFSVEPSGQHVYREVGDFQVRLELIDKNHPNLKIEQWSNTIFVSPPVLNLTIDASQHSGVIPLRVDFRSHLDIKGGPTDIEYIWDFGDGTVDRNFTKGPIQHTYYQPGAFTVNVTARDRIYHTTVTTQITIEAKPPSIASHSTVFPLSGTTPLRISGMGNADVKGYPSRLDYTWYIDGQIISFQRDFHYIIVSPGTHKVTVIIADVLPGHTGRDKQSWNVVVRGNQPSVPTRVPGHTPIPPVVFSPTPVPGLPSPAVTSYPRDTTPPKLMVSLSPSRLWPPDHKMVQITAKIQVSDNLDPDPKVRLVSITCNQAINGSDINGTSFGTDDRSFYLRADRDGARHEDRFYLVTYSAADRAGNIKVVAAKVIVPFNEKNNEKNETDERRD